MSTSRKKKNEFKVSLSLNCMTDFAVHTLPQKPREWDKWINDEIWDNFIKCCNDAVPSEFTVSFIKNGKRKSIEPSSFIGFIAAYLLVFATYLFGYIAARCWILFWILITMCFVGFVGDLYIINNKINKQINKIFINGVKSNLTYLNNKYNQIIKFTVNENIVYNKINFISTISIKIELLAKNNINYNTTHDIQRRLSISQQESERQRQLIEQLLENDKSKHLIDSAKLIKLTKLNEELTMKCNELEIRYNEKVKKSNYTTWDAKDITNWIVDLDKNRYNKYYHDLLQNLINENINGYCLNDLDKNDLHRLGIIQFKDKKNVYDSLQQLIQNKVATQHEGAANKTEYH